MSDARPYCLPVGLPMPVAENDGLSAPFWDGLNRNEIRFQHCTHCGTWQWGPEWICHRCLSFDLEWRIAQPEGRIYSITRAWHPAHAALKNAGPYLIALVEIPSAGNVRVVGNVTGDQMREIPIGSRVTAVFEHHDDAPVPYTLLQWALA